MVPQHATSLPHSTLMYSTILYCTLLYSTVLTPVHLYFTIFYCNPQQCMSTSQAIQSTGERFKQRQQVRLDLESQCLLVLQQFGLVVKLQRAAWEYRMVVVASQQCNSGVESSLGVQLKWLFSSTECLLKQASLKNAEEKNDFKIYLLYFLSSKTFILIRLRLQFCHYYLSKFTFLNRVSFLSTYVITFLRLLVTQNLYEEHNKYSKKCGNHPSREPL